MFLNFATTLLTCFDGEGGEGGEGGDGDDGGEKLFTQDDLNRVDAEAKRKFQVKQREMAAQLQELQTSKSLSEEEKEGLQSRIEELQTQYMTAEERARRATEEAEKKTTDRIATLEAELGTANNKFASVVIRNDIVSASAEFEAYDPDQIAALLGPRTKLVEAVDSSGESTGELMPRVSFPDTNKDGEAITMELTVAEAVKRMRELPDKYGNLFRGDKTAGIGQKGSAGTGTKKLNIAKIARNAAEYRRLRAERPELFE